MQNNEAAGGGLRFLVCAALLLLCAVGGGGTRQGLALESFLQIAALASIALALWLPRSEYFGRVAILCVAWLASLSGLLAFQLVPLPPEIWASLRGRAELAEALALAGVEPGWRAVSLDPQATLRALLALAPPAAVFILAAGLSMRRRVSLMRLLLVLAILSVFLGFAQLAGGTQSPLRWHEVTSNTNAVGPFANRNHLATLLSIAIPIGAAWLFAVLRSSHRDRRAGFIVIAVCVLVLLVVGLAVTRSRAGVLLGGAAMLGVAVMVWLHRQRLQPGETRPLQLRRWLLLAAFVGVAVSVQYGLLDLWSRLRGDAFEDRRWTIAATTIEASKQYGLLGTGGGTFPAVYPGIEPAEQRSEYYVNRAHNDWLEWMLEGGLPMLVLIVAALLLLGSMVTAALRNTSRHAPWQSAAAIGVGIVGLHSALDYPLRTTALACVAAVLVAVMLPEPARPPRSRRPRRTGDLILETDPDGKVRARASIPAPRPHPEPGLPRDRLETPAPPQRQHQRNWGPEQGGPTQADTPSNPGHWTVAGPGV